MEKSPRAGRGFHPAPLRSHRCCPNRLSLRQIEATPVPVWEHRVFTESQLTGETLVCSRRGGFHTKRFFNCRQEGSLGSGPFFSRVPRSLISFSLRLRRRVTLYNPNSPREPGKCRRRKWCRSKAPNPRRRLGSLPEQLPDEASCETYASLRFVTGR